MSFDWAKSMKGLTPKVNATCSKCNTQGVWVDHGHTVGKGWYCRTCKDDIIHSDNTWGLSANQIMKVPSAPSIKDFPGKEAVKYLQLDCRKGTCNTCFSSKFNPFNSIDVGPGDIVRVENYSKAKPHLGNGTRHVVTRVNPIKGTIHVYTDYKGKNESREYVRCRFSKIQKIV